MARNHEWYVLVKLKDVPEHVGQTELEYYAQDAADSLHPSDQFESAHLVMLNSVGQYVRPHWAKYHDVGK